jgi:hypothetical protein
MQASSVASTFFLKEWNKQQKCDKGCVFLVHASTLLH